MITHLTESGWEIIYHRAHALLAAQIAGQWRRADAPPRLYETLAAISHHDDLEREWEGDHLTESGAPLDFRLGTQSSIDKLYDLVDSARYRGRWVALLTSMHLSFLNESKRGDSAKMDKFLDDQLTLQAELRTALGIPKDEAAAAYAFMEWCDQLSLILCQKRLPADERALEISTLPDGTRYDVLQLSNGYITVQPWCFESEKFVVNVEACYLSHVTFKDNKALSKALQAAPIKELTWTFVKQ
ncbi:DUF3891 family protein [Oculatella sp. LEGE 06141]|uniref:DUF3891 family protein n=1 Tax=Oculatella sp. LEGE 06141 TaxID=1828648 RepID=UPI00187E51B5|nr:DUF3891 family protein [Oculatella sp. LEGE 06141]